MVERDTPKPIHESKIVHISESVGLAAAVSGTVIGTQISTEVGIAMLVATPIIPFVGLGIETVRRRLQSITSTPSQT